MMKFHQHLLDLINYVSMNKLNTIVASLILATGLVIAANSLPTNEVGAGNSFVNMTPDTSLVNTISWKPTATTSSYTLTHAESGSIIMLSASGTTLTLPAVRDELNYKFMINGAVTDANIVIDSAEGDNIQGSLIVAGAVVDCDAEDQINFVYDGENIGDFVELYSDGTSWLIGASGALTASKLTCTDPS